MQKCKGSSDLKCTGSLQQSMNSSIQPFCLRFALPDLVWRTFLLRQPHFPSLRLCPLGIQSRKVDNSWGRREFDDIAIQHLCFCGQSSQCWWWIVNLGIRVVRIRVPWRIERRSWHPWDGLWQRRKGLYFPEQVLAFQERIFWSEIPNSSTESFNLQENIRLTKKEATGGIYLIQKVWRF